jgi:hypothetical protein
MDKNFRHTQVTIGDSWAKTDMTRLRGLAAAMNGSGAIAHLDCDHLRGTWCRSRLAAGCEGGDTIALQARGRRSSCCTKGASQSI